MRAGWLLLRSHGAPGFLVTVAGLTAVACALGPGSRAVITRDGALGEPLPFVLALTGAAAAVCLVDPSPDLTAAMPRPAWTVRCVLACSAAAACGAAVLVSGLVAPGLVAATARNVLAALAVTFAVALWRPLLAWVPTTVHLALSWFWGTATADDAARAWAVPAQPPDWSATAVWAAVALAAAAAWVLAPQRPRRGTGVPSGPQVPISVRTA